ncbi:hypothetical protein CHU94_16565 [Rhodoferax sp. TH121]|uniref:oligosaccharide flippase family protein n=1 Tax=Rhodoferax sp. TH121 TaxID=2022803 RepID=UPI000B95EF7C|nr:oligosaccharide flippase family protein [Rhodoferax sp. TH121]OYQ39026.1 hypothetical protein CHU94_16565 [Rhodoferax sp. TH121]
MGGAKNLVALTAIQASNAALPLLIFPYVLAVVGADLYANIVLTEAIAMLVVAVVLYSFEIDGVRQVVGLDVSSDGGRISRVFSGILGIRMLLFLMTSPIALFLAWAIDPQLLPLMICWLLLPLSYVLQPGWLCQGLQDNAFLAVTVVGARLTAVVILFFFLDKGNYLLVPLAVAGFFLVGVVLALIYSMRRFRIHVEWLTWVELSQMLSSGKYMFASNLSVAFYRDVNVLILGGLGGSSEAIASYSMAEKIIKMAQAAIRPINQVYLPKVLFLTKGVMYPSRVMLGKIMALTWPQVAILASVFFGAAIFYGCAESRLSWLQRLENRGEILFLVSVMTFAAFAGVANYMLGMVGLSSLGASKFFFRAVLFVGVCNLAMASLAILLFAQLGAAISFVVAEMLLFGLVVTKYARERK